jgi:hypothetical protein
METKASRINVPRGQYSLMCPFCDCRSYKENNITDFVCDFCKAGFVVSQDLTAKLTTRPACFYCEKCAEYKVVGYVDDGPGNEGFAFQMICGEHIKDFENLDGFDDKRVHDFVYLENIHKLPE